MANTFKCPSCGAPLDYNPAAGPTIRCPYCDSSIIVPEELRPGPQALKTASDFDLPLGQINALQQIATHIRSSRKIEAIKVYRQAFGVGLKEAKESVEAMTAGQPVAISGPHRQVQFSSVEITTTKLEPARRGGWLIGCFIIGLVILVMLLPLLFLTPIGIFLGLSADDLIAAVNIATPSPIPAAASPATPTLSPTSTLAPTPTPSFATITLTIGSEGIGPGQFNDARHVAVDGAGYSYVAEWVGGSRVQRFDPSGQFVSLWAVTDKQAIVTDLAADRQGTVYVIQGRKISRYNGATGESLGQLEYEGQPGFEAVAVTADGGLAAFWSGGFEPRVIRFDAQGKVVQVLAEAVAGQIGSSELNPYLAVDGLGNTYILGGFSRAIFKYGPEGNFINRFGSQGNEPGQFRSVLALAVDNQGRVYVGDGSQIEVFGPDSRYLDTIELEGGLALGLAFNDKNELFVASRTRLIKLVLNK